MEEQFEFVIIGQSAISYGLERLNLVPGDKAELKMLGYKITIEEDYD